MRRGGDEHVGVLSLDNARGVSPSGPCLAACCEGRAGLGLWVGMTRMGRARIGHELVPNDPENGYLTVFSNRPKSPIRRAFPDEGCPGSGIIGCGLIEAVELLRQCPVSQVPGLGTRR
jgi:hypothetical protein